MPDNNIFEIIFYTTYGEQLHIFSDEIDHIENDEFQSPYLFLKENMKEKYERTTFQLTSIPKNARKFVRG